jgi:hypothetical protein
MEKKPQQWRIAPLQKARAEAVTDPAELSPEAQLDLLEQLAAGLPADLARQLEEQLRARLAK